MLPLSPRSLSPQLSQEQDLIPPTISGVTLSAGPNPNHDAGFGGGPPYQVVVAFPQGDESNPIGLRLVHRVQDGGLELAASQIAWNQDSTELFVGEASLGQVCLVAEVIDFGGNHVALSPSCVQVTASVPDGGGSSVQDAGMEDVPGPIADAGSSDAGPVDADLVEVPTDASVADASVQDEESGCGCTTTKSGRERHTPALALLLTLIGLLYRRRNARGPLRKRM